MPGSWSTATIRLGRVLQTLEDIGELDNTLIMLMPDNGASSEGGVDGAFNEMSSFNNRWETLEEILPRADELGGPASYNHYPWGWSWAGNTPFRRWKKEVYRGGCTDNLIVHWPKGIQAKGENPQLNTPTPSIWCPPCWKRWASSRRRDSRRGPVAHRGRQLCPHL